MSPHPGQWEKARPGLGRGWEGGDFPHLHKATRAVARPSVLTRCWSVAPPITCCHLVGQEGLGETEEELEPRTSSEGWQGVRSCHSPIPAPRNRFGGAVLQLYRGGLRGGEQSRWFPPSPACLEGAPTWADTLWVCPPGPLCPARPGPPVLGIPTRPHTLQGSKHLAHQPTSAPPSSGEPSA